MAACGIAHPERPGVHCIARSKHDQHYAMHAGEPVEWPNEDWVEPPRKTRRSRGQAAEDLKGLADQVPPRQTALDGTEARPPISGNDDPWSSHLAADRIEPTRGTRKAAVLSALREARGGWVDGAAIANPEVGGSEGLRRLRELRVADGWPIERRPHPTSTTSWQYRLLDAPLSDPSENSVALHSNARRTEESAAYSELSKSGTHRMTILRAFAARGEAGYTHHEVSEATGIYLYTAAPRCTELLQGGWLVDTGRTRPGAGGSPAIVWAISPEGATRLRLSDD